MFPFDKFPVTDKSIQGDYSQEYAGNWWGRVYLRKFLHNYSQKYPIRVTKSSSRPVVWPLDNISQISTYATRLNAFTLSGLQFVQTSDNSFKHIGKTNSHQKLKNFHNVQADSQKINSFNDVRSNTHKINNFSKSVGRDSQQKKPNIFHNGIRVDKLKLTTDYKNTWEFQYKLKATPKDAWDNNQKSLNLTKYAFGELHNVKISKNIIKLIRAEQQKLKTSNNLKSDQQKFIGLYDVGPRNIKEIMKDVAVQQRKSKKFKSVSKE